MSDDVDTASLKPPLPQQQQDAPGITGAMNPTPDHGETSYRGSDLLLDRAAIITGGDSGIGRAVAIAFAREGADVLISYLNEDEDARETARWIEEAGRRAVLVRGDIQDEAHCRSIVERSVQEFGRVDILVNNAAHQANISELEDFSSEEWETTFRTNIDSQFYLSKAVVPHMKAGASIINTASIQATDPSPTLLAYAATKGAIVNFTVGLAQLVADKGIRVNAVAPGPVWTPLIPATMPAEKVESFGKNTPLGRPAQPAELAGAYVLLASDRGSYITAAVIPVTGGRPF